MMVRDLDAVVRAGLCCGCGLCESLAGRETVEMRLTSAGQLRPHTRVRLQASLLKRILRVCPGVQLPRPLHPGPGGMIDTVWGPIRCLYRSWAADPSVRHRAAAGGTLTALGRFILESGRADRILHVRASTRQPLLTDAYVSRTPDEVLSGSQSRYGPAAPLVHVRQLLDEGLRFAIIAKPCDIAAIRNLAKLDPRVDQQVPYLLTLFCGGVPSVQTAERIARYQGIEPDEVSLFRWRGEGWPGATVVEARDGRKAAMSYAGTWYAPGVPWTYDIQFRCKICPDAIGEHADVSAPDGWLMDGSRRLFDDAPGVNIAIGRTRRGEELLTAAKSAGALVLEPFDRDALDVMHADHRPRKQQYLARRIGVALAGQPVPRTPGVRAIKNAWAAGLRANLRALGGAFRRALVGRNREPLT